MREENPDRLPEKVVKFNIEKERGYLYYIDEDGDVARVPAKWNKDPKFLEKVEHDKNLVDKKLKSMKENYVAEEEHEEPIPVSPETIPAYFASKDIFYVDKAVIGAVGDDALHPGHVKIFCKEQSKNHLLEEGVFTHNLTVSSICASLLYEGMKAQGTNIIVNEKDGYVETSVIPRFENDGLDLFWEIKPGDKEKIKVNAKKIKDALIIGEKKDFTKVNLDGKKTNIIDKEQLEKDTAEAKPKVNYMIEHLRRTN